MIKLSLWLTYSTYSNAIKKRNKTTTKKINVCQLHNTWDRSICIFLFNRTTLQVFVTYLVGTLYVHPLWFYRHQHGNRVHSKLFVACQRWWFQSVPIRIYTQYTWDRSICKKYIYSYLKCIVYDKLLKPWQSFRITLYMWLLECNI